MIRVDQKELPGHLDAVIRGTVEDAILALYRPGEGKAWYLPDHLGTVRALVNSLGVLINHVDYDRFGRILQQTNPASGDRFL